MFFSLFITPIIIFRLGIKTYGIYLFINAVTALFSLLDLGLGTAVVKHLSNYYGKKDDRAIATLVHSANLIFFLVGAGGFILSICITIGGAHFLPSQFESYRQYSLLFMIAGLMFCIASTTNTYTTILIALQRFDINTKINIASTTTSRLGMVAIVVLGGSLQSIFLFQLLITIFFAGTTFYQAKKILPSATFRLRWDKKEIKHCYQFGFVTFINNIASIALASLDQLIIPFYVGPSNLTYYSVPGNVTNRIPGVSNTLSGSMFPTTSQLEGEKSISQIETLYVRSFRLITIIAAAFTITSIAFAYKILFYWLSVDFANHSTSILIILALTNFILALFGPLSSFLLGLGKIKFLTTMSVVMSVLNILLLFILLPRYGIIGAALAYLISVLPVAYVFYYTEKKYLILFNRTAYYFKKAISIGITSAIIYSIDAYFLSPLVVNLATLIIAGATSLVLYLIVYKMLGFFEKKDWDDIEKFFHHILKKIKL